MGLRLIQAMRAGAAYFLVVFAIAFGLGVVRTLVIAPAVGATIAVMIEVPIIMVVSWFAARRIVTRHALTRPLDKAISGLTAFILLMVAELALAHLLTGQTPAQWAASLFVVPGIIGLSGQIVFALMPLLIGKR